MSIFKTRKASEVARPPVVESDSSHIEGVTLATFAVFTARVGQPGVLVADHERIAVELGFPAGRYDLIRNAWLTRVYSSPALGKQFGTHLDAARAAL